MRWWWILVDRINNEWIVLLFRGIKYLLTEHRNLVSVTHYSIWVTSFEIKFLICRVELYKCVKSGVFAKKSVSISICEQTTCYLLLATCLRAYNIRTDNWQTVCRAFAGWSGCLVWRARHSTEAWEWQMTLLPASRRNRNWDKKTMATASSSSVSCCLSPNPKFNGTVARPYWKRTAERNSKYSRSEATSTLSY